MNAFTNLPLPVRIAIPAVLVLLVGLILWMTALRSPEPVEVLKTKDYDVYQTAKLLLERNGINADEHAAKGSFMLLVPPGKNVTDAAEVLAGSGVQDRTVMAVEIECPAAPGFTGTKAANERSTNCEEAKSVQGMLLAAGATAANVKVSQQENGTLLGPEKSMNVVAQVFLPSHMRDSWNAEQAARAISRSVGTTLDRVSITDGKLQTMFDGTSAGATGSAATGAAAMSGLGCGDIASANEVETKRAAVRNCYEQTIGQKLTELLGGSDRFVLTVEPTIDSNAITTNTVRNMKGPTASRSSQRGNGQSVEDVSTPPSTQERTIVNPAGDIKSLRISVILDKNVVTEDQKVAVTSLLASQIDAKRGDPAPIVKLSTFANGAGDAPSNEELKAIQEEAKAAAANGGINPQMMIDTRTETPKMMLFAMVGLVVVTLGAVFMLWRRSSAMAAERTRLEEAFSQEQKLFESFAQQNPDRLAQDLNDLFGAPSAPERAV